MRNIPLFVFLLIVKLLYSQVSAPKYSNEFLSLGISGKSIALSESVVATTNDASAGMLNPAGLVRYNGKRELSLMHAEYFAGIAQFDYIGYVQQIDTLSAFSFSAVRFGVDDIPDTRYLFDANGAINYDNVKFFSANDYAFYVSYSRLISNVEGLSLGGNLKVIYRSVGEFATAWGTGLDFGLQLHRKFKLGVFLKDATSTYTTWFVNNQLLEETYLVTGNTLPENSLEIALPRLIIGVAKQIVVKEKFVINSEIDFDLTFDGKRNTILATNLISVDPHAGIEIGYDNLVFVRYGIGDMQYVKEFDDTQQLQFQHNFGIGLKIKKIKIDYALTNFAKSSDVLFSNVFSIGYDF